jgi:UDP-glucose 4-epimerase
MRVLVTGVHGFIGAHVRAEIESRGWQCVPYDRPAHDVLNTAQLRMHCEQADAVIHLAGVLGTSELIGDEAAAVRTNVIGAVGVYDMARAAGIPVVQIGTGHKGQPNTYAITKACAEDLALARAQWNGEQITVVRAYHVYGPGQKPPAPWGHSPVRKIFPAFACAALSGQPLEVYGSGMQAIDLVHVTDVARVLADAIKGPYGTVVEAGTGKPTTVLDAAWGIASAAAVPPGFPAELAVNAFTRLSDIPAEVRHLPMRPGEPLDATVVASAPACGNPWPYLVPETIAWYRDLLTTSGGR